MYVYNYELYIVWYLQFWPSTTEFITTFPFSVFSFPMMVSLTFIILKIFIFKIQPWRCLGYITIKQTTSWAQILPGNLSNVEQMWSECLEIIIRGTKKKGMQITLYSKERPHSVAKGKGRVWRAAGPQGREEPRRSLGPAEPRAELRPFPLTSWGSAAQQLLGIQFNYSFLNLEKSVTLRKVQPKN